ncbi:hypothetical protein [Serinibacter salmoneus]|uniref:Uncharacterized protein n=1 Tax=Serinibacter salmoneus TaxID=556530 RepID=A0A2A9CZM4_9MICO|nr:hypothetical protein [Serinibacter salmoneus]PFG19887.1 hypothetical protein ATL40_1463 [Serinibacter salmoneus]
MADDDAPSDYKRASERRRAEQRRLAQEWLNEKWVGSTACPICTQDEWTVTPLIRADELAASPNTIVVGGPVYATFHVICTNCGYVHVLNAGFAGIPVDPYDQESGPR